MYRRFMDGALPGISYFYALEENPNRHGFHIHALWDSSRAPRKATHRRWLDLYGRNRIEPVRNFSDVVSYCSKYVTKERSWWNFHLSHARYAQARRGDSSMRSNGTVPPERPAASDLFERVSEGELLRESGAEALLVRPMCTPWMKFGDPPTPTVATLPASNREV